MHAACVIAMAIPTIIRYFFVRPSVGCAHTVNVITGAILPHVAEALHRDSDNKSLAC